MVNFPPERFENLTPDEIKSLPTLDEAFDDILREEYNVIRTFEDNPNDDRETNIKLCGDEGLTFSSVAPHIDFTEEEKSIFRNRIANGFWQDFCSRIVFPKHHDRLMEDLLRVPERDEYKKYFEWE